MVQESKDGLARVQDFLEQVALWSEPEKAAEEEEQEGSPDKVNVMTLHLSKGLEFAVVFIVGRHKGCACCGHPCRLYPACMHALTLSNRLPSCSVYTFCNGSVNITPPW